MTQTTEQDATNTQTAIIIGAGFAGIATALRLRALGYEVTLLERLQSIGGRAQVFERGGYRHDAGPTVITAPFLFDELFELFDEKLEDHLEFVPLDPFYRFHFADGSQFDYRASIDDTLDEIRRFNPEDADGYLKLLEKSKRVYDIGFQTAGAPTLYPGLGHGQTDSRTADAQVLSQRLANGQQPSQAPVNSSGILYSSAISRWQSL